MLIDTHAHLYYGSFQPDLDQVIRRAKDANLKAIINIGTDLESSKKSIELENNQIKLYASIGIHPHEATQYSKSRQMSSDRGSNVQLEQIYTRDPEKVVAVGECGLDYFFNDAIASTSASLSINSAWQSQVKKLQRQLFLDQINLAKKLNLPLIIHCRDSWADIFLPELQGTTGVFHSFTATETEAKKALDLGYYLGLSCIVTYPKNEHLRQIIKWAPLNRLLTETDCPFLPPQTQRGQRNEPANITEVIKVIARMKSLSEDQITQAVWQNTTQLFRLPTNPAS
ncbi:hypothetical protein A3A14_01290 [Candidatus Daviesbacteria bacterium RIFCSPLOWO2_01_FULL_43_38]|uniref:Hydrolase TatD n=1 Tax=Candidatus Daviesbacteria bacterium RIFCSPHIGHO2_12_FULL_43_11 TaxID=1797780 RepID=A0A1F5K7S1_9BACT|nr:MAG: hypothetical protein A2874_02975 [Candidatus Daviesbacteria bacterium RIFCSPHIGHO2_01_FULL_43_17]OGE36865.1 MAG: hypothetical protein A3E45_03415 [Candidatus Daviesbacteria bacterium RIFCSPHIGHO2_12_FULL_43_11]OGE63291.1 MAG: hypothetical protein A3A14_01290 [Candidatus Daviesbacteria bacterium RIFCSPLOWO2_01_FULL_43_38]